MCTGLAEKNYVHFVGKEDKLDRISEWVKNARDRRGIDNGGQGRD